MQRSVIYLGVQAGHLCQSSFLPFPRVEREGKQGGLTALVDSRGGMGRPRSPAAKHFDAIYAVKQLHKIHIDVLCTTKYRNQRALIIQPLSAELIAYYGVLAMIASWHYYHGTKSGGSVHIWTPNARKWGHDPKTPTCRIHACGSCMWGSCFSWRPLATHYPEPPIQFLTLALYKFIYLLTYLRHWPAIALKSGFGERLSQ